MTIIVIPSKYISISFVAMQFSGPSEYCITDTFTAQCQIDEVVKITSAVYGRMKIGKCARTDMGMCLLFITYFSIFPLTELKITFSILYYFVHRIYWLQRRCHASVVSCLFWETSLQLCTHQSWITWHSAMRWSYSLFRSRLWVHPW